MKQFLSGGVDPAEASIDTKTRRYNYIAVTDFYESLDGGTSRNLLFGSSLEKILKSRSTIPCRVVITVYLSQPFYSAPMSIPTGDIIKSINTTSE
ncbi:hypothetical protein [Massilia glaciei]|uniref:hypothetical protein n=1 Tax=Massilia glaciei TaxID=1524097 RepID=UPI0011B1DDDE|nr:hypothetical protein [Massilia glaciei]